MRQTTVVNQVQSDKVFSKLYVKCETNVLYVPIHIRRI